MTLNFFQERKDLWSVNLTEGKIRDVVGAIIPTTTNDRLAIYRGMSNKGETYVGQLEDVQRWFLDLWSGIVDTHDDADENEIVIEDAVVIEKLF